jgi:hypothetical protein
MPGDTVASVDGVLADESSVDVNAFLAINGLTLDSTLSPGTFYHVPIAEAPVTTEPESIPLVPGQAYYLLTGTNSLAITAAEPNSSEVGTLTIVSGNKQSVIDSGSISSISRDGAGNYNMALALRVCPETSLSPTTLLAMRSKPSESAPISFGFQLGT